MKKERSSSRFFCDWAEYIDLICETFHLTFAPVDEFVFQIANATLKQETVAYKFTV